MLCLARGEEGYLAHGAVMAQVHEEPVPCNILLWSLQG